MSINQRNEWEKVQDQVTFWLKNNEKLIKKFNDELFLRFRFLNPPYTRLFILSSPKPGFDSKRAFLELKYNDLPPLPAVNCQRYKQKSSSLSDYLITQIRKNI